MVKQSSFEGGPGAELEYDECTECGAAYSLYAGWEDDGLCHPCAHKLAHTLREALEAMVEENNALHAALEKLGAKA